MLGQRVFFESPTTRNRVAELIPAAVAAVSDSGCDARRSSLSAAQKPPIARQRRPMGAVIHRRRWKRSRKQFWVRMALTVCADCGNQISAAADLSPDFEVSLELD